MTKFKNSILSRTLQEVNESKRSPCLHPMSNNDSDNWTLKDFNQYHVHKGNSYGHDEEHGTSHINSGMDLSREEKILGHHHHGPINGHKSSGLTSEQEAPFGPSDHSEGTPGGSGKHHMTGDHHHHHYMHQNHLYQVYGEASERDMIPGTSSLAFRGLSGVSSGASPPSGANSSYQNNQRFWNQVPSSGNNGNNNVPGTPSSYDSSISAVDSPPSTLVVPNLKKSKRQPQPIPDNCKDEAYWERRKRNNESAKRSREMRRMKEHQTTMKVILLEQENLRLKTEVTMLRNEVDKLREIVYVERRDSVGVGQQQSPNDHKLMA